MGSAIGVLKIAQASRWAVEAMMHICRTAGYVMKVGRILGHVSSFYLFIAQFLRYFSFALWNESNCIEIWIVNRRCFGDFALLFLIIMFETLVASYIAI